MANPVWTVVQELEKLRLKTLSMQSFADIIKTFPTAIASITDTKTKVEAEKCLLGAMHMALDMHKDEPLPTPKPVETDANIQSEPIQNTDHLYPVESKKKLGRVPKVKAPQNTTEDTPMQQFLDDCFDLDPNGSGKTHVAHVRAMHRLWRGCNVNREETNKMVEFFKQRFNSVLEMDEGHDMKCSFYRGLIMKPWTLKPSQETAGYQPDVALFVKEKCEVHVMGRAKTTDMWDEFVEWKQAQEGQHDFDPTPKERNRFLAHLNISFVYYTGIAIKKDGKGVAGFYGLYLNSATDECREVGYNRSPNTHTAILKLDARGKIIDTITSQDIFAHDIVKKSSQYVCIELSKCFADNMKPFLPGDGYAYMRAKDHAVKVAAIEA